MTEDKIKDIGKEYTINRCGWDSEKMQDRRNKIKKIYKAANPSAYVNANDEKTLDEFVKAISMGELSLKQIEEIQTELAKEKETKDKEKQMTDRKQTILKILLNLNLYNNDQERDYIAEGYAVSNLTLEQVQEQVSDIKKKEDQLAKGSRFPPGVL